MYQLYNSYYRQHLLKQAGLLRFILCAVSIIIALNLSAQNVLMGLTSNGSINGKGTAFSISTTGTDFSVINGFTDWGNTPNGNFFKNDDGNFYGMTSKGGTYDAGTIFMMTPTGNVTILRQMNGVTDGGAADGELIKGPDGYLYGLTSTGGTFSYGTIFKISTSGTGFTVIKHFSVTTDGANPHGHLTLASDGNFYGITYTGGSTGAGTVFKLTPAGVYSVIHPMNKNTEGGNSFASLTEGIDGNLYGTTYSGGQGGFGTIFKVTKNGELTVLKHLVSATDGSYPRSDLIQAKDGFFYGTCYGGGQVGNGTIFKVSTTTNFTVVKHLANAADGGYPYAGLMQDTDGSFYGVTRSGGSKGGGTVFKLTKTYVYSVVYPLNYSTEGNNSSSDLVKGNDGSLYAMTSLGGSFNQGIIFKTTTAGIFSLLGSFNGSVQGNTPYSALVKGKDSAYYGTTSAGGAYNAGTIIKICGGITTVLFSFNKAVNGGVPKSNLIQASDGNFYGTTSTGGPNSYGTLFKITPGGNYSILHNFVSSTEGAAPVGGLIQAKDGYLYGMTSGGGGNNGGTIYRVKLNGDFTVLKSFVFATDGGAPVGNLVQASDSNFYGMTSNSGRIFKLTPGGIYTNLHTFNSSTDGYNPTGSLVEADDGFLYGTCSDGGSNSAGTIFRISTGGVFKNIRSLVSTQDGRMPKGSLLQGPDGMLYGTTSIGGTYNTGTIFKLNPTTKAYTVLRHMNMPTDGGNAYGSLIFAAVNNLVADAKSISLNEDASVKITLSGSGGSPLKYNIVSPPVKGSLTGAAPNLTYKPNKNYNGSDQFSYVAAVGCQASVPAIVHITVNPVADTPVLAAIGNKTIKKDSTLKFTARATDGDGGQVIRYSLIGAPAGATINATTGAFTWKPTTTGSYTFKVRATDNGTPALYDEEQITVTVTNSLSVMNAVAYKLPEQEQELKVFPIPANSVLHVTLQKAVSELNVKITDISGKLIASHNLSNTGKTAHDINITALSNGIYLLQATYNGNTETVKFVKQ